MPGRSVLLVVTGLLVVSCSGDPTGTGVNEAPGTPASAKPGSPPAAPAANPEIAWSNDGIWVMNADGSNQARVTPRGAWLGNPTWSPIVGTGPSYQFAYVNVGGDDTVRAVDVTIVAGVPRGGIPRPLASPAAEPAWSPLGDEIAYVRTGAPGGIGIWVTNVAGTIHTAVHQPPASDSTTFMRPAWRSDGLALAFWEDRNPDSPENKKILVVTRASRTSSWSTPTTRPPGSESQRGECARLGSHQERARLHRRPVECRHRASRSGFSCGRRRYRGLRHPPQLVA